MARGGNDNGMPPGYLIPTTMESGPTKCSRREVSCRTETSSGVAFYYKVLYNDLWAAVRASLLGSLLEAAT